MLTLTDEVSNCCRGETVTSLHQLPEVNSKHQGCGVSPRHTHGGSDFFLGP